MRQATCSASNAPSPVRRALGLGGDLRPAAAARLAPRPDPPEASLPEESPQRQRCLEIYLASGDDVVGKAGRPNGSAKAAARAAPGAGGRLPAVLSAVVLDAGGSSLVVSA